MSSLLLEIIQNTNRDLFTDMEVKHMVKGSKNRRYGLVKRALAKNEIVKIRRGLYVLAPTFRRHDINLFALAQWIYGPSCVSMESALAYHGWIPEAVYTVTSICFKRSCDFDTPLGRFSYTKVPLQSGFQEVERVTEHPHVYFMARPVRALLDYVYVYKKSWPDVTNMVEDLRLDSSQLRKISTKALNDLDRCFANKYVTQTASQLRKWKQERRS